MIGTAIGQNSQKTDRQKKSHPKSGGVSTPPRSVCFSLAGRLDFWLKKAGVMSLEMRNVALRAQSPPSPGVLFCHDPRRFVMIISMRILRGLVFALALAVATMAEVVDFTVESPADGNVLKSSELRGKFVALHFLLKTECPFCLKHTHDYAKKAATLPNVTQVFLKPDTAEEIKAWTAKLKEVPGFPSVTVYRDPDAALAGH